MATRSVTRDVGRRTTERSSSQERSFAFGLLGPLEVWVNRRRLELPRHKHRVLLALLLLHVGEVLPRDRLIDEMWKQPPKKAVGSLQNFVSDLRRALGAEVVATQPAGYSLEVEPECVDLHRFERLVANARSSGSLEARSNLLRGALALWRGPPLIDFAFEPFAQLEIARLDELRTAVREELIDAELDLGHHTRVVPELETLVAENPLRERLRAQMMLALYRSGRQTEALDMYQDARRTLSEEVGLDPGEELQQLERAILTHDPSLQLTRSTTSAVGQSIPRDASSESTDSLEAPGGRPDVRAPARHHRLVGQRKLVAMLAGLVLALAVVVGIAVALTRRSEGGFTVVPNSVAVVDSQTNQLVGDIVVGRRPVAIVYGEDSVWVANADDGTVSRIDPKTRKVVGVIRVGPHVADLAMGFGSVWAAGGKSGTVTRIDPESNEVKATLRLGPTSEANVRPVSWVAAGAGAVWATHGNDTLLEIDPATADVVSSVPIPAPAGLAAGLGAAWVVTEEQRLVKVVPRATGPSIEMSVNLFSDALAPTIGGGSVWLIVYKDTGEIWRVDPSSGAANITPEAGRYPLDLAVGERGETVWAVDATGAVVRLNPNIDLAVAKIRTAPTIRSSLAVGGGAVWVAVQD
jgi:YVTN family beta-propeller protein